MHYDMDAFYASIEINRNPKLKNKPLVVGENIVTTASYEARKYGIHSAMKVSDAKLLCPKLIAIPVDKKEYIRISNEIHNLILKITNKVEFIATDEGYIDLTGIVKPENKKQFALKFKERIKELTNLTCSVGIGFNKLSAKIASDINKPFGIYIFENEKDFIISAGKAMEEMAKIEMFISHNFDEDLSKAISIENNTLHIFTAIRNNYGDLNLSEYVFKYKNNKFELVSLKSFSEEIHSSYETKYSFFLNFLTKKVKIETLVVDSKTNKNLTDNKKEKTLNITEKYILDDLTGTTKSKIIKKYVYNK